MPFISESSARERRQQFGDYQHQETPEFSEVFAASVGQVLDEELSVSSALNREGFQQRKRLVDERIAAGEINPEPYRRNPNALSGGQPVDYNRIAIDLQDPDIKTDEALQEERNALLAQRRRYAQDVIERGSGMAQFTGGLTAYMLDPINIATIGIAVPATTARATSILGRAALASRNAVLIEGATELGIQALVFQHKQAIDSPYDAGDALANIGMAATGAAVLGGAAGGLSAWLEKVVKLSDDLPQTKDVVASKDYLRRMRGNLKNSPKADAPENQIQSDLDYLKTMGDRARQYSKPAKAADQYSFVEHQKPGQTVGIDRNVENALISGEGDDLITLYHGTDEAGSASITSDGKIEGPVFLTPRRDIAEQYGENVIEVKVPSSELGVDFDLGGSRILDFDDAVSYGDKEWLDIHDAVSEGQSVATKKSILLNRPSSETSIKTSSGRERDILDRQGLADEYDADIQAFNSIESPIIRIGDEEFDPVALIQQYDDELSGLDDVLKCAYG